MTSLKDGGWVIVWISQDQDGSGTGIYQQRFDRNGNATFPADMLVNITTTDGQDSPSVASLADGGWIVTWSSADQMAQECISSASTSPDGLYRPPTCS